MATDEELNFAKELILFYKQFVAGNVEAIRLLADIQEKYPKQYQNIQQIQNNPESISDVIVDIPPQAKDIVIFILLKASGLGRKASRLFDMNPTEQRAFATELNEFVDSVEKRAKQINDLKQKK